MLIVYKSSCKNIYIFSNNHWNKMFTIQKKLITDINIGEWLNVSYLDLVLQFISTLHLTAIRNDVF